MDRRTFPRWPRLRWLLAAPPRRRGAGRRPRSLRIGFLGSTWPLIATCQRPSVKDCDDLGYVEGPQRRVRIPNAGGEVRAAPALAAELGCAQVDVIWPERPSKCWPPSKRPGLSPCLHWRWRSGFDGARHSLARPDGNVTGWPWLRAWSSSANVWNCFKQAVPGVSRVAVLCKARKRTS